MRNVTALAVGSDNGGSHRSHVLIKLRHWRGQVRNKLERRLSLGLHRRSRSHNRQPCFNIRTRVGGGSTPYLVSRLANTLFRVQRLSAMFPVRLIRVESAVFDTRLMQ